MLGISTLSVAHPKNNSFRIYTMEMVSAGFSCVREGLRESDLVASSGEEECPHHTCRTEAAVSVRTTR